MSTFPAAFNAIVMPDIRKAARLQGLLVAIDHITFGEAEGALWAMAAKRGAYSLPNALQTELGDAIQLLLLTALTEAEAARPEYTADKHRKILTWVAGRAKRHRSNERPTYTAAEWRQHIATQGETTCQQTTTA